MAIGNLGTSFLSSSSQLSSVSKSIGQSGKNGLTDIFRSGSRTPSGSLLDRDYGEALNDPAPSWRYLVEFPEISGISERMAQSWVVAESFTLTHPHIPSQGRFGGGSMTYFPDFNDISGTNVELYEDVNYSALHYIYAWKKLILDEFGNYAAASEYKYPLTLNLFSHTDSSTPVMKGTLHGCWPSEVTEHQYSYEGADRVKTSVQFSVDSSTIEFTALGKSTDEGSGGLLSDLNKYQKLFREVNSVF